MNRESKHHLEIHSKIWIGRGEAVVLSTWRIELLEAVEAAGSLSRAAAALDIPYRTAWERIKEMEAQLGVRLLESASGGVDGGSSRLTPQARDLCRRFRRIASGIHEVIARRFAAEFGELGMSVQGLTTAEARPVGSVLLGNLDRQQDETALN